KTSCCQEYPESFKMHRLAQFAPWSVQTLSSYLNDLQAAHDTGRNLMRVKYARMQGLIESENAHPLIDEILRLVIGWQKEMFRKYPGIMNGARPLTDEGEADRMTSFATYARGELETYSLRTLRLLHSDMILMQEHGGNWSEAIYDSLVKGSGYASLADAEHRLERARDC
ncbi:MAG: DUF4125 family protein, partial [Desulfobacteraceae bacterium]|nr:DUF4125 family protein [Desulfobacteraceae bacterium]